jgi:DNA-binding FadR family transcriptional regulator
MAGNLMDGTETNEVECMTAHTGHAKVFAPIRAPKIAELVAATLRDQLIRGELPDGHTLPSEQVMMDQFGVSRPTLREALRILESEQIVSIRRGSRGGSQLHLPRSTAAARYGGFFLQARGTSLGDVWRARAAIEIAATRLLASDRSDDALRGLREALDDEAKVIDEFSLYPRAAAVFHNRIIEVAGNETLRLFGEMTVDLLANVNARAVAHSPDDTTAAGNIASHKSHERLVQLLEVGVIDKVDAFWRKHMEISRNSWSDDIADQLVNVTSNPATV